MNNVLDNKEVTLERFNLFELIELNTIIKEYVATADFAGWHSISEQLQEYIDNKYGKYTIIYGKFPLDPYAFVDLLHKLSGKELEYLRYMLLEISKTNNKYQLLSYIADAIYKKSFEENEKPKQRKIKRERISH